MLEAWGGLRPQVALKLGDQVMDVVPDTGDQPSPPPRLRALEPGAWLAEILSLVGFVSMATWGVPLGRALPNVNVDMAFKIGVPLALAVQWMVRRRYFSTERRLGSFGTDGMRFIVAFLLVLCAVGATGPTGLLIAVLEIIWFSGYLLSRDGIGIVYFAGLGATTWALYAHLRPEPVLTIVATVLAIAAVLRVVGHIRIRNRKTQRNQPVAWREGLPSATIGASLGLMVVFSLTHVRPNGWTLAAALVPAGVGSLVAAATMRTLWFRLDTSLATSPGRMVNAAGSRAVSRRMVRAWAGYLATCVLLSGVVGAVLVESGQGPVPVALLLCGFALFCALAMMADFQHSWNRIGWAFVITVPACAVELATRMFVADAAAALVVGAGVGLLIAVVPQMRLVRGPARILATSVSIP